MADQAPNPARSTNGKQQLSARELKVLAMAARGLTNDEMARSLDLTVHGVKYHLSSIYRKLGVANRTEAVVHFLTAARVPEGQSDPTPR